MPCHGNRSPGTLPLQKSKVIHGRTHLRATTRACIKFVYGILFGLHEPTNGASEGQTAKNIAAVVLKDLSTHQTQQYPPLTNPIDFKMMPIEFCAICSPT